MTAFQAEAPGGGPAGPIRVSVLIPMYNSAPTIERAVRSALAQTLHDIEVLVADDASTDGGGDVVARLANADPRVRLICLGQNGGKPRAMNILVAQARGEWIAVLDADDAYHKLRLELLLDGAVRAGTDMAADNLNYIDAGITDPGSADGGFIRFGFDPADGDRVLGKADMVRNASSFATFDYGILKPVIRRDFVMAHRLRYDELSGWPRILPICSPIWLPAAAPIFAPGHSMTGPCRSDRCRAAGPPRAPARGDTIMRPQSRRTGA